MQGDRAYAPGITPSSGGIQSQDQSRLIRRGGQRCREKKERAHEPAKGSKAELPAPPGTSCTKLSHRLFIIRPLIRSKRDLDGNDHWYSNADGWNPACNLIK